jgi:hypothetical protein
MSIQFASEPKPNGIAARAIAARTGGGLPIQLVRIDGGTQSRAMLQDSVIDEYADAIKSGVEFPSIIVFYDGSDHWLADGFHRLRAFMAAGRETIPADVRQGTRRDAILYSVGANEAHGLRRTNDDKRRAVLTLLNDAEWSKWSDSEIGRQCRVDHKTVKRLRAEHLGNSQDSSERTVKRNGSTYTMNTAAIGKSAPKDSDDMDFAEIKEDEDDAPVDLSRGRLNIAEGITLDEIARQGMARERAGEEPTAVAKSFSLGVHYYRMACDVTFLFDRGGYSKVDSKLVAVAFRLMVDEQKIPEAHELINPVAVKVWGSKRDTRPRADREPARVDQFEHAFGIIAQTCVTAAELDLPYLSETEAKSAAKEVRKARQHLATLLSRIERIHE